MYSTEAEGRLSVEVGVTLRRLSPCDGVAVRELCRECFPLSYPESWFDYILSDKPYSLGAFSLTGSGALLGMIVAELQPLAQVEGEVGPVLERAAGQTTVMYIISLGVCRQQRQRGLGTLLVSSLMNYVGKEITCKGVYLHVLASNTAAVEFYRKLGFQELARIAEYYRIQNTPEDALLYHCCVNGGEPFSGSVHSYLRRYVAENFICSLLLYCCAQLYLVFVGVWRRRTCR